MGKKVFEVEISNTGPKGYETATVLSLPATRAEFQDALQKAESRTAGAAATNWFPSILPEYQAARLAGMWICWSSIFWPSG